MNVHGPDLGPDVQWFRSRFNDCFDKAEWAKSRLVGDVPDSAMLAERLIFDRSLELVGVGQRLPTFSLADANIDSPEQPPLASS